MVDPGIQQAAEFLAAHSVLRLGLGMLGAAVSLVAVALAVRLTVHVRGRLRLLVDLTIRAHDIAPIRRLVASTSAFIPNAYLALHLALATTVTAAVTIFVILAEQVAGGEALAAFDVTFAHALWNTATPGWQRIYMVLKETFERTRPEFADPMLASLSWRFPSGHAMGTFIFCGRGSHLLLRDVRLWPTGGIIVMISLVWCLIMSFSRLYLGVHFASDVAAGLVAGGAWSLCVYRASNCCSNPLSRRQGSG